MIDIRVSDALWRSSMMPEGVLVRWRREDGAVVAAGDPLAEISVEDSLHEITAPAAGRFRKSAARHDVIEPGSLLGQIEPEGAAA